MGARIFIAVGIAIGGALVWADSPPAPQPATADIEQLIRDLGDKRFPVREQASKKLWQIGAAAEPALRRALKDPDVEIAQRSKALLDKFAWGIFPDTPDAIVAELERYRDGDDDVRRQSANALAAQGPAGFKALGRLRARAQADEERHFLAFAMTQATVKALPALLKAREYDALESLLEACLDREADDALANYTALMILRDKLPAALKRWQAEYEAAPSPRSSELLAYLHRAAGNLAEARRFAAVREELLDDILWELGDWAALATRPVGEQPRGADRRVPVELAVKAAYLRLAGDAPASAAHIEKLRNVDDPNEEWTVVKGLLLNERPTEALERLAKSPVIRDVAFDLLVAQMRYREAFALADKPAGEGDEDDRRKFTVRHARALYLIGEHDQAGQLFARVAGELKSPVDGETAADLIQTQVRLGLRDAAREAAAMYLGVLSRLAVDSAADPTRRVLEALFPKRGVEAKIWWQFLRQKFPKDDERAAMRRLRGLMEGGELTPTDLSDLTAGVIAAARDDDPNAAIRARLAAATAEEAAGQFDPAIKHLTDTAQLSREASVCIRLGDLLVARKRYAEAEEAYGKAAARDATDALPVYLQGWAQIQAGQKAAGETMIEQARLLTLGDTRRRAAVAEELTKRDLLDLARRERDLVRQLGWHRAWAAGGYLSYLARDSAARRDYARAADSYDRVVVGVLGNDFQFVENSAYLSVPALARAYRARAALAAGKLDVVRSEAEACLTLTPGNLDLAILLVPEFVKRGRTGDADALYARSAGAYADLCKNHPASAFAHNSAAWLAACCRRDLDAALAHAEKATELAPKYAGYRDTLAEVYFQRGDKAKAIALMKECQRMEPKNEYFVKQLARFEAGDPSVPPPPEGDPD